MPSLQEAIGEFVFDPLGFVVFAYPWGEGRLKGEDGPDEWQAGCLERIGEAARAGDELGDAIQMAVKSGHGVGKSALSAWIIHWFLSTRSFPQAVVTANTMPQLLSKTWRELAKWHKLSIHAEWFAWTATKFYLKAHPEDWFAAAIPWSESNSEAFAGTHEKNVLMLFDEASGIGDKIWEVADGAMTTPGAIWIALGNPTRPEGRFYECFNRFRHRWVNYTVDARTAKKANKGKIQQWLEDYGEDSDYFRVRVRGEFPRSSSLSFIDPLDVQKAEKYEAPSYQTDPLVLALDPARFGACQSVFTLRQGRKVFKQLKYREMDSNTLASRAAELLEGINRPEDWPNADIAHLFVDGGGIGGPIIDRIRSLGYKVTDVMSGMRAGDPVKYFNKRAECWGRMRDALKAGLEIPKDSELYEDLTAMTYGFSAKTQIQLDSKEDLMSDGKASPDCGDSLALTYAEPVRNVKRPARHDYGIPASGGWMG